MDVNATELRFEKTYKGFFAWLNLFSLAFFNAGDEVVLTVARLAWPVSLRNLFRKNKQLLVLHNFDPLDGKPGLYHTLLRSFIKRKIRRHSEKYRLVAVSPYWQNYFEQTFSFADVFLFPNFFDNKNYIPYRIKVRNPKLVHLGMWSEKIDKKRYLNLLHLLNEKGFLAYFSSMENISVPGFPISYFDVHEAYLEQMSGAAATVILNRVEEGWPRLVHESFLVGTQVIAYAKGGVPELIATGNGYIIDNENEVVDLLEKGISKEVNLKAFDVFDESAAGNYLAPIVQWIHE